MKNIVWSMLLISLLVGMTCFGRELEAVGEVFSMRGEVKAVAKKGEERVLSEKSAVYLYDRIITGLGAKVQIVFKDDTQISQGEQSEMLIDKYVYNPENSSKDRAVFQFFKGIFRAVTGTITRNNPENFSVKTRKTVIGIRGCELLFNIGATSEDIYIVDLPARHSVVVRSGSRFRRREIEIRKPGQVVVVNDRGKMRQREYTPKEVAVVIDDLPPSMPPPEERAPEPVADEQPVLEDLPVLEEVVVAGEGAGEEDDEPLPKYMREEAFEDVKIKSKYEPATKKMAEEILSKYKSVPGGVTMEGVGRGLRGVRDVQFQRSDNSFLINEKRTYEIPVTRREMKDILLAIDENEKMGVSLAGEQIVYGALDKQHRIARTVRLVDQFLGHIAFAVQGNEQFADYKLANGYVPKVYDGPQESGMCVFFRFGDYDFKKTRKTYELASCDVAITLVPTETEKRADDGGALPDYEAIKNGYMPIEWEMNVKHISDHMAYYMQERMMRMVNCYGEAAAFSRALKENGIDLKQLAASM